LDNKDLSLFDKYIQLIIHQESFYNEIINNFVLSLAQFASTLPKPHEPALKPKLCQRAYKADPICPQGIRVCPRTKNKINLCFVDSLVCIERMIILELNN